MAEKMAAKPRKAMEPAKEKLLPPGPGREEQVNRLVKTCAGNLAAVARVLGVSRAAVGQWLAAWTPEAKAERERRRLEVEAEAREKKRAELERLRRELGE